MERSPKQDANTGDTEIVSLDDYRERLHRIDPLELDDENLVGMVVSRLTHPSTSRYNPSDFGKFVEGVIKSDDSWGERIALVLEDMTDDDMYEAILSHDELDVISQLENFLRETRKIAEDVPNERKAALLLRELRAGEVLREQTSDYTVAKWPIILHRLGIEPKEY